MLLLAIGQQLNQYNSPMNIFNLPPGHLYDKLFKRSLPLIRSGSVSIDTAIDSGTDNRFGITLLCYPGDDAKARLLRFTDELRAIDPDQYYYPASDLHITVLSIISCYEGFNLDEIPVAKYVSMIQKCLAGIPEFEINLTGVTSSGSGILACGYFQKGTVDKIRAGLRTEFKKSALPQRIDVRYVLETAHITLMRFRKPLANNEAFGDLLERYKTTTFGSIKVRGLALVYNDWYHRKAVVLGQFTLDANS
jgi:2'-5' RNA ligase